MFAWFHFESTGRQSAGAGGKKGFRSQARCFPCLGPERDAFLLRFVLPTGERFADERLQSGREKRFPGTSCHRPTDGADGNLGSSRTRSKYRLTALRVLRPSVLFIRRKRLSHDKGGGFLTSSNILNISQIGRHIRKNRNSRSAAWSIPDPGYFLLPAFGTASDRSYHRK